MSYPLGSNLVQGKSKLSVFLGVCRNTLSLLSKGIMVTITDTQSCTHHNIIDPVTPIPGKHQKANSKCRDTQDTYKKQEAFVLTDGTTAAEETQQKEHRSHSQHDVRSREEQRVGRHYLSKTRGIHNDPDPNSQQARSSQLSRHEERRERETGQHKTTAAEKLDSLLSFDQRCLFGESVFLHGIYPPLSR